jgi:predicted DsbA family dithiol-disulfide isomerase
MSHHERILPLDFYFDVICPWCWIGLRQLVQARARLHESHPWLRLQLNLRSWPLLPDLPAAGVPYEDFYRRRLGGEQAVAHRRARIQEAGVGIVPSFAFDQIARMPNALSAHRLIAYARKHGSAAQQEDLLEALFNAFFGAGRDIGDHAVLLELGEQILGKSPLLAAWLDDAPARRALPQLSEAPAGMHGVPALAVAGLEPMSGVTSVDFVHTWLAQAGLQVCDQEYAG